MATLRHCIENVALLLLTTISLVRAQERPFDVIPAPQDVHNLAWKRHPIEGFAWPQSIQAGEVVNLYVSVDTALLESRSYDIAIRRLPYYTQPRQDTTILNGRFFPLHFADHPDSAIVPGDTTRKPVDFKRGCLPYWESSRISFSTVGWQPGMYLAKLVPDSLPESQTYFVTFIVRPASPTSKVLVKHEFTTLQAYNYWGGGSLYSYSQDPLSLTSTDTIALARPLTFEQSLNSAFYLVPFVKVLEDSGYAVEYCNNIDLDSIGLGQQLLSHPQVLVLIQHDEYWYFNERGNIENYFKERHGNIAHFAANTCYWRVNPLTVEGGGIDYRKLYGRKDNWPPGSGNHPPYDLWRDREVGPGRPEAFFLGSEYPIGTYNIEDPPDSMRMPDHWIFRGTGIPKDSLFGYGIVDPYGKRHGIVTGEIDNTASDTCEFRVDTLAQRTVWSHLYGDSAYIQHQMVYYEDTNTNSRVFSQGGGGWQFALTDDDDHLQDIARMKRITMNIIDHFSGKKYRGKVHTNPTVALEWRSSTELDGDTEIPIGKFLRVFSPAILTIDSGVTFSVSGTLEINGNVTIVGPGAINVGSTGDIVLTSGATLTLKTRLDVADTATISVPANTTLRIDTLAHVYLAIGSGFSVSGTLIVRGTAADPTLLTRSESNSDYWPGITLNEQSNATFTYCDIRHAQVGINANTVIPTIDNTTVDSCKIGISMFQCAGSITNSSFTNNIIKAIIIDGENPNTDAAPILTDNFVSSNTTGIYVTNSAPTLERNTVTSNSSYGIWCDDGGNPFIGRNETDAPGNNILENNGGANLLADDYSCLFAGYAEEENSEVYGGYNSFGPEKHQYDTWAGNESEVIARKNFWSEYPPEEGTSFREDSYAWIDWDFPLDSYSARPFLRSSSTIAEKVNRAPNDSPGKGNSLLDELLAAAMAHRSERRFDSSMGLIRQYIAQRPIPPLAPVALVMLHQIAEDSARAATSATVLITFSSYLDSLLAVTTSDRLNRSLLNVAKNCRVRSRNWQEAIAIAETIATLYPHTTLEEHALYTLFSTSLFGLHHRPGARQALNQMQQQFPESQLTALAELLIEYTVLPAGRNGASTPMLAIGTSQQSMQTPAQYALYQNFPNPFNPSTTIKYDLPVHAHVTLKIYDILGKEVLTLMNDDQKAGSHSAMFDASRFSSGVYLYRLQAGDFVQTRKLVLLK